MSGGQIYLLRAIDMAKVGGTGWSPNGCEYARTNLKIPCPLPTSSI